jgi:hypothetical protein
MQRALVSAVLAVLLMLGSGGPVRAQVATPAEPHRVMGRAQPPMAQDTPPVGGGDTEGALDQAPGPGGVRRQRLEQQLRARIEHVVQQRLQLSDAQLDKLRETNKRWAPRRRALVVQEGAIRREMRDELRPGATPDQHRLGVLIDSLFTLERSRLDMLQSEQRELATYLTPEQRVRYYALQEQLRRRIQAMRQRNLEQP